MVRELVFHRSSDFFFLGGGCMCDFKCVADVNVNTSWYTPCSAVVVPTTFPPKVFSDTEVICSNQGNMLCALGGLA